MLYIKQAQRRTDKKIPTKLCSSAQNPTFPLVFDPSTPSTLHLSSSLTTCQPSITTTHFTHSPSLLTGRTGMPMNPLLLRLGVALALSLAGYLRFRPHRPPPSAATKPPTTTAGLREELRLVTRAESLTNTIHTTTVDAADDEGYLLPEFPQLLLEEFNEAKMELEEKSSAMEEEIGYLHNLIDSLRERERTLEVQLLGYHGFREQETAVKELENRVKIDTTTAKLLSLKVESLRDENERLRAKVSDYAREATEVESARETIRVLKRKLRSDGEQAEEKIAVLKQRLSVLEDMVHRDRRDGKAVEEDLKRFKELEDEAVDLRNAKTSLTRENSELKLKLRSMQMPASSALKSPEAVLLEEIRCLKDENDKLKEDIEQLHNDRCADIEELVYVRWINACLRYELRNYQPPTGKEIARDLSRSLSPQSERKAKQLIVEYADFDINEINMSLLDFDSDYCSSQASNEEPSNTSTIDIGSTTKTSNSRKTKFVSNLKKLVLGKDHHNKKASSLDRTSKSCCNSERRESVSPCSYDDATGRGSNDSVSSCVSVELGPASQPVGPEAHTNEQWQSKGSHPPRSSDIHRLRRPNYQETKVGLSERRRSDVGTSCRYQRLLSGDDGLVDLDPNRSLDHVDIDVPEKIELRKLAKALRNSCESFKAKKRAASFSFS